MNQAASLTASTLTPYVCPRRCAAAIDWYVAVLDAVEVGQRYVDPDGRVGHAEIIIGSARLMLSDEYPDYGAVAPLQGSTTATFALQFQVPDADATVAKTQTAGAIVQRPVEEQTAGHRMGTIMDPFGLRWMISTRVRDVSAEELAAEASEFSRHGASTGPLRSSCVAGGMLHNRSMPQDVLIPVLGYPAIEEAVQRLSEAFGFWMRWQVGEHRAQLAVGRTAAVAIVQGDASPGTIDHVMVRVDDVDGHRARALAAGAQVGDVHDYMYGERQYTAVDLSGRSWVFTQSIADVAPEEWGAQTLG